MARLPTYDNFRVAPQGGQPAQLPAHSGGMEAATLAGRQMQHMGRALAGAGDAMAAIALDRQKDVNEGVTRAADVKLADAMRGIMFDPEQGFLNALGGTALERVGAARQAIDDAVSKAGEGLAGIQQQMFAEVAERRRQAALGQIDNHLAQQSRVFNAGQADARVASAINDGAMQTDPALRQQALATAIAETHAAADLRGLSTEQRELEVLKTGGMFHGAVADTFSDPRDALAYLDQHKAEMPAAVFDRMRDAVQPAAEAREADAIAERVLGVENAVVKQSAREHDLAALLARVDQMGLSPDLANRAKAAVRTMVAQDKALLGEQQERAKDRAWAMVDNGQTPPASLMALMKPSERRSVRAALSSPNGGFASRTDAGTYNDLRDMLSFAPDDFKTEDLDAYRSHLTAGAYNQLKEAQRSILKDEMTAPDRVPLQWSTTMANRRLPLIGVAVGKSAKTADQDTRRAFVEELDRRLLEHATREGKVPNDRERERIADQLLIEAVIPGRNRDTPLRFIFGGSDKPARAFEINAGNVAVPETERVKIARDLRARGVPVTDDNIARTYAVQERERTR